ncbi:hypothetical protein RFI_39769, partial [Reticulomyxa filosa]
YYNDMDEARLSILEDVISEHDPHLFDVDMIAHTCFVEFDADLTSLATQSLTSPYVGTFIDRPIIATETQQTSQKNEGKKTKKDKQKKKQDKELTEQQKQQKEEQKKQKREKKKAKREEKEKKKEQKEKEKKNENKQKEKKQKKEKKQTMDEHAQCFFQNATPLQFVIGTQP